MNHVKELLKIVEGQNERNADLIILAGKNVSINQPKNSIKQHQTLIPVSFLSMLALNLIERKSKFGDNDVLWSLKVVDCLLSSQLDNCRFSALLIALALVRKRYLNRIALGVLVK